MTVSSCPPRTGTNIINAKESTEYYRAPLGIARSWGYQQVRLGVRRRDTTCHSPVLPSRVERRCPHLAFGELCDGDGAWLRL